MRKSPYSTQRRSRVKDRALVTPSPVGVAMVMVVYPSPSKPRPEKLEEFLQQVMQQSLAEYMRRDADDGLMPTPEGQAHESAESPAMEQQEAPEAEEPGEDDEDAMARELAAIRNQRGVK